MGTVCDIAGGAGAKLGILVSAITVTYFGIVLTLAFEFSLRQ
jgi:hypothetical protein